MNMQITEIFTNQSLLIQNGFMGIPPLKKTTTYGQWPVDASQCSVDSEDIDSVEYENDN